MGNLSITTTEVQPGSGVNIPTAVAGATIVAGDLIYLDASDSSKAKLADADLSAAAAVIAGIAVGDAVSGQILPYQTEGTVTVGATAAPTKGVPYVLSGDPGKIALVGDLASLDNVSIFGVGSSSSAILIGINNTGIIV